MSRRSLLMAAMLLSVQAAAQSVTDETVIRQVRARSNAAIARHDTAGIAATMAENIIVVSSTSARSVGRAENLARLTDLFRSRPDVVFERLPDVVRVFEPWGMASEYGKWTGTWSDGGDRIRIGGSYFAKWRRTNGTWLIESETFVPERCTGGAYCRIVP